jgi:hypothetical protein
MTFAATFSVTGTNNANKQVSKDAWNALLAALDALGTSSGGTAAWGGVTGTLSAQTDLQAALDAKQGIDSDLTAIAALTTTSYGRGALELVDAAALRTYAGLVIGTHVQAYNANLTTYAGIAPSANVQTLLGAANYAAVKTSLSLTIGTDVQAYDADLAALAANSTDGLWAHTGAGTGAARTITGTANEVTVANGSGAAGNPTLSLPTPIKTHTITLLVSDPNGAAISTGDGKAYWPVPSQLNGCDLVAVAAGLTTVSSSGLPTVQIANVTQAADMLTTKLSIDANELHSKDATTAAVIDTANDDVATGDLLRIDVDVAGTGAKGLMVELQFRQP